MCRCHHQDLQSILLLKRHPVGQAFHRHLYPTLLLHRSGIHQGLLHRNRSVEQEQLGHRTPHHHRYQHFLDRFQYRSHPRRLRCLFQHHSTSHRRRRHHPMRHRWNRHRGRLALNLHPIRLKRSLFPRHQ